MAESIAWLEILTTDLLPHDLFDALYGSTPYQRHVCVIQLSFAEMPLRVRHRNLPADPHASASISDETPSGGTALDSRLKIPPEPAKKQKAKDRKPVRAGSRALKRELIGHLRSKRRIRRPRHATARGEGRGEIVDAISIRQRPAEVEDRAIPGHWEGDLVEGSRGTFIATRVERQSRFVIIVKVADKRTETVVAALIKAVRKLPVALRRSLTWDRGTELADQAQFTIATDVQSPRHS